MRVGGGLRLGLAEYARRHLAHHAGHQVAVALEPGEIEVTRLREVHLAAVDDLLQLPRLDAEGGDVRHQRLHHRVARLAAEGARDLGAPPRELCGRHAGVRHLVDHVVDLAAEGIEGRDRRAAVLGQEEEGVVEAAARRGGLVLDVLLGGAHRGGKGRGARLIGRRLSGMRECRHRPGKHRRPGATVRPLSAQGRRADARHRRRTGAALHRAYAYPSSHASSICTRSVAGTRASAFASSRVLRIASAMRATTSAGCATPQMRRPKSISSAVVG